MTTSLETPTNSASEPVRDDLLLQIERQIDRKAQGRVRFLQVECREGVVHIHGQCQTHHAKQLVQEAASELLDSRHVLVNEIVIR